MRFRRASGGLSRDHRDLEIERLRGQLAEAWEKEVRVRNEERERFSQLSAASKRFAASMRSRMDERQRQQRRLDAQHAVGRVIEGSRNLAEAAPEVLRALGERLGWEVGVLWTIEDDNLRCGAVWHSRGVSSDGFEEACRSLVLAKGAGLPGRVWQREEACWVADVLEDPGFVRGNVAAADGLRCALAFPIQDGGSIVGVFELLKKEASPVEEDLLRFAYLVGHQIGQFVERRRAERERDRALAREREARQRVSGILESINDAFVTFDRDWCFTYVNRKAEEFWSRPRAELLGKTPWEVFPGSFDSEVHRALRTAMEEGKTVGTEAVSHVTGHWISIRAYPSADGVSVYFQDISERKAAEQERDRLLAREWVAQAQSAERERISRELHDRVAHSMAVAHQSLQLHEILAEKNPRRAEARLRLAREMIKTSLESTRNLSAELRRLDAEDGLESELRHLLDVSVPPGIDAGIRVGGDETGVPGHVRGQLFLVLREAVRNAVSHSGCGSLSVAIDIAPERVVGSVEDDGKGFEATGNTVGVGLRSMKERAELLDGRFELDCEPGRGTRVQVSVPLTGGRP